MSFPSINTNNISDPSQIVSPFNRLQNQIQIFINYLNGKTQLDSIQLSNISLVAGNNSVSHTLGRPLVGWTITDLTSPAVIYRYQASNNTTLFLNSSLATTISLTVF